MIHKTQFIWSFTDLDYIAYTVIEKKFLLKIKIYLDNFTTQVALFLLKIFI